MSEGFYTRVLQTQHDPLRGILLHITDAIGLCERVALMCCSPVNGCLDNRCLFDPLWPVNGPRLDQRDSLSSAADNEMLQKP